MPGRTNRIKQNDDQVSVEIHVNIVEDHGYFVASSPALDLTTYAKTSEKARERFLEAVGIFLEDTLRKGTLEKVLLGLGWGVGSSRLSYEIKPPYTWDWRI